MARVWGGWVEGKPILSSQGACDPKEPLSSRNAVHRKPSKHRTQNRAQTKRQKLTGPKKRKNSYGTTREKLVYLQGSYRDSWTRVLRLQLPSHVMCSRGAAHPCPS